MKMSKMFYEIEPFKEIILASKVKVDLGGQRSFFDKLSNLMKNIAKKIWLRYLKWSRYEIERFKDIILASKVKVTLGVKGFFFWKSCAIWRKPLVKRFDEYIENGLQIRALKRFILASEAKNDLGGQRSFFEKVVQFNEKHCWKYLMKISRMVNKL